MGHGHERGTVLSWHKAVGDSVTEDEPLAEVEAEKVEETLESPATGTLSEILVNEGDTVEVRTVVAVIETSLTGAFTQRNRGSTAMDELSLPFDVVVVGAGVNGLGIARDAALRGLRVALLEQDDICSGVSAWSGRLVHGGLRYLEHRDFALVRESLRERELLFRLAPHLVKPVRLLMPFYSHNRRSPKLIRLGMVLYDALSFDKKTARHEILSHDGIRARFTGIGTDGLTGSAVFTDGQVEYAERLCVELGVAAAGDGAVHPHQGPCGGAAAGERPRGRRPVPRPVAGRRRRAARRAGARGPQRRRPVDRPHLPHRRSAAATAQRRHQGQPPHRRSVPGRADRRRLLRVQGRRAARAGHPLDGPLHARYDGHPVRRRPGPRALRHRRDGLHPRRGQHAGTGGET
jgi:pyruvate/2-oxoglutarate dehydrogenase complex dihydrolipoamide acyltransferase (E2) component